MNICEGQRDLRAMEVKCRLQCIGNIVSSGAIYHRECASNFRIGKPKPSRFNLSDDGTIKKQGQKRKTF